MKAYVKHCMFVEQFHTKDVYKRQVYARKNIYSQRELADKINITPITIANVERKTNVISIDNFLKIVNRCV